MKNRARPINVCEHVANEHVDYFVVFSGTGTHHDWLCEECKGKSNGAVKLFEATDHLWANIEEECFEEGLIGLPELKVRESSLRFEHKRIELPVTIGTDLIDLQPSTVHGGKWFFLLRNGNFGEITITEGETKATVLYTIAPADLGVDDETALLVSSRDAYAAVYGASSQFGVVVDVVAQKVALALNRGKYRPENSYFPVAFFERDEKLFLVTATDWNMLDVFDLSSGTKITARKRENDKEHYLDYFHARLSISPSQNWIADNGWVWAPLGVVHTWSLDAWLKNPWESEDGATLKRLVQRQYHWDGPLCWLDDNTLAIYGFGVDDDWIIPAARVIDVQTGKQLRWFAGPKGRKPPASLAKKQYESFVFDEYLFAINDEEGTSVWDVQSGERLLIVKEMCPKTYHRVTKEFASWDSEALTLSRLLQ